MYYKDGLKETTMHTSTFDSDQGMWVVNQILDQMRYFEEKRLYPSLIIMSEDTNRELQAFLWETKQIVPTSKMFTEFMGMPIIVDARNIGGRIEVVGTRYQWTK